MSTDEKISLVITIVLSATKDPFYKTYMRSNIFLDENVIHVGRPEPKGLPTFSQC